MKSVHGLKYGDTVQVRKLIGADPRPEGDVLWTIGWVGSVVRVYNTPTNRGKPSVEVEFPNGERFVYVAEEVALLLG